MDWKVGVFCDARDKVGKWCESVVIDIDDQRLLIHYLGWSHKWDTWYNRDTKDLAPLGTYIQTKLWELDITSRATIEYFRYRNLDQIEIVRIDKSVQRAQLEAI